MKTKPSQSKSSCSFLKLVYKHLALVAVGILESKEMTQSRSMTVKFENIEHGFDGFIYTNFYLGSLPCSSFERQVKCGIFFSAQIYSQSGVTDVDFILTPHLNRERNRKVDFTPISCRQFQLIV